MTTTCKSSQSTNNISSVDMDANICPLTEENLAIHTQNFPPSKDARRRNCRLFVESQIPVVAMELKLQQQREREISSLEAQEPSATIDFVNPFHDPNEPLEEERSRRSKWFTKLKQWIRMDSGTKQNKTRHLSWSAGTEKEDHKIIDNTACQKRDSGISIFSNNNQHGKQRRRSSPIAAIPITRQPKFSPPHDPHEEIIAYQYPRRMRRKSSMIHGAAAAVPVTPATSDDKNDNHHAVEKTSAPAVPATACLDCKG